MSELWVYVKFPKHLASAIGQERRLSLPSFSKGRWKHGMKPVLKKFMCVLRTGYKGVGGCIMALQWWQIIFLFMSALHGLQTFLQTLNQVCSLGMRKSWQHGAFVQQIEWLMCSPVWMLLSWFSFWKGWRTLEADAITAAQTWCFITGYLKNKRRSRHFISLSSYDVTYINYLPF